VTVNILKSSLKMMCAIEDGGRHYKWFNNCWRWRYTSINRTEW